MSSLITAFFAKCARQSMKLLSEKQRLQIYRKLCSVPAIALDPQITIEIARTKEDLTQAYKLLHDCYVGIKIIDPQPSGLRCNLFSFLPQTTTIVAKLGDIVIGTVSLIRDSDVGLPSDKQFLDENNNYRRLGKTLIEVSALAVSPKFRSTQHGVSLLLMKYLYHFSRGHYNGDQLIAVVHPKAEDFYKALWQFERQGKVIQYDSLKKALGIHLGMSLSESHFQKITKSFGSRNWKKNLALFVAQEDSRFQYPNIQTGKVIHPVITPDLLQHFCLEKEEIWSRLSASDQSSLLRIYSTYFGEATVSLLRSHWVASGAAKEFRTPLQLKAFVKSEGNVTMTDILDLSAGGCFLRSFSNTALLPLDSNLELSFYFQGESHKIAGQVAWQNDGNALYQNRGLGIRFQNLQPKLSTHLQRWLYTSETSQKKSAEISTESPENRARRYGKSVSR